MRSALFIFAMVGIAHADDFRPVPAESLPGYYVDVMPCKLVKPVEGSGMRTTVECKDDLLGTKSLRELTIMRNTIYARYGWDGFRKPWLRDYFHAQPWFHANPKFGYHLASDADKKNAHFIATQEQSLNENDLERRRADVFAHHGKVWDDKPTWNVKGKLVKTCHMPKNADMEEEGGGNDCWYAKQTWFKANPSYTDALLTADDKIELGLISRALGSFSLDGSIDYDEKGKGGGFDKLLDVNELRQLSLRDLRLMRNTIYARRGRQFKSQILRDHFTGMSWYHPDATYSDARLSKTDARNIALIRSVENEFGGSLSDEDWLTEPATDGA